MPEQRRELKDFKESADCRHGNIMSSAPNTLLASGPEIPRKVCLRWGRGKRSGRTGEPAKPLFSHRSSPSLDKPLTQSLL